jgi:hypothetical protein
MKERLWLVMLVVTAAAAGGASPAFAAETPAVTPTQAVPSAAAQVEQLVAGLAAKEGRDRDEAEKKLVDLARSTNILDVLQKHAADPDPETRVRIRKVIEEAQWGEPVRGVQVRLKAERREWKADEAPTFLVDVVNHGQAAIVKPFNAKSFCRVEVDGLWYGWGNPNELAARDFQALEPGKQLNYLIGVTLGDPWALFPDMKSPADVKGFPPKDSPRLKLAPGKHVVRVSCADVTSQERAAPPPVSGYAEIVILPPVAAAAEPAKAADQMIVSGGRPRKGR